MDILALHNKLTNGHDLSISECGYLKSLLPPLPDEELIELPSVTLRDLKFKSDKARDLFLVELMFFCGERLEEYECEHRHVT